MFEAIAKFRMLAFRRHAPEVSAPANDNRPGAGRGELQRARATRLICRWELGDDAHRPTCRWELEGSDEPSPSSRAAPAAGQAVSQNCLPVALSRKARRSSVADLASVAPVYSRRVNRQPDGPVVLHARH